MKAIHCDKEMVSQNLIERSPVLLFMGGGIGLEKAHFLELFLKCKSQPI